MLIYKNGDNLICLRNPDYATAKEQTSQNCIMGFKRLGFIKLTDSVEAR